MNNYGRISEYLRQLQQAGFVARDFVWDLKTGKDGNLSKYRLKDNYIRFYLKYIEPNLSKINRDLFVLPAGINLYQWNTILGLQFENLVLNNKFAIHQALGIKPEEIVFDLY